MAEESRASILEDNYAS